MSERPVEKVQIESEREKVLRRSFDLLTLNRNQTAILMILFMRFCDHQTAKNSTKECVSYIICCHYLIREYY